MVAFISVGSALAEPVPATGTLVVMVLSNSGLVIAADSRTTAAGRFCDNAFKILVSGKSKRMVATVTGTGIVLAAPPHPIPIAQICEHVATGARILDIEKVVSPYLDSDSLNMDDLVKSCIESVIDFGSKDAGTLQRYRGHEMFSVVLAKYEPETQVAGTIGFVIGIDERSQPFLAKRFERTFGFAERQDYVAFGETDFLNQHVVAGVGRQFLSIETIKFHMEPRPIKDVSLEGALALAKDLLRATELTTRIVPPPSGIGGPTDIVLLGDSAQPTRIQWKAK
jgi:hypothetical protein